MDNNEIVKARVQISHLLALASEARGRGDAAFAEQLIGRAMLLADQVEAFEAPQPKERDK